MIRSALVLCLFVLLALASTHPLWQSLDRAVPGDVGDPVLNTYLLAWDARALVTDPLHLFDAGIFFPLRNTLAYSENLIGDALLVLPIALAGGEPVAAYNFAVLGGMALSGYGMYLLTRLMVRDRGAAVAAGIVFAFAPYRLVSLAHLQLVAVQWLPFALIALARAMDGRRGALALFCVFAWLQIASSLHGALFLAVLSAVVVVATSIGNRQPGTPSRSRSAVRVSPAAVHWLVLALAVLPLVLPYLAALPELRAARLPEEASQFVAQPLDWFAAWGRNLLYGDVTAVLRSRTGFTEEHLLFTGLAIPLLALCGLWFGRASRWTGAFAALLVLSILLASWDTVLQLPLASVMRVPARWATLTALALAVLSAMGVAGLLWLVPGRTLQTVSGVALCAVVFVEGFSAPFPVARIGSLAAQNGVYHYLAQSGTPGAVIELPLYVAPDAEYPEGKRMYAGTLHWRPLVNGYSGVTPARQGVLAARMRGFPDEASQAALLELGQQGVRWLIVHAGEPGIPRREWVQSGRAKAQASGQLRYVQAFDDNDLFEIVP